VILAALLAALAVTLSPAAPSRNNHGGSDEGLHGDARLVPNADHAPLYSALAAGDFRAAAWK